jgi:HSP20 family molecular chaperone IbpA
MIFVRRQPTTTFFHPLFFDPVFDIIPGQEEKSSKEEQGEQQQETPKLEKKTIRLGLHVHVTEGHDAWTLIMDLPGVKSNDVEIEEEDGTLKVAAERTSGGEVTAKYQQQFALDPLTTDADQLKADLSDGVLTMRVPKKTAPESVTIETFALDVPEVSDDTKVVQFTIDLPGVMPQDVKVEYHSGTLYLEAERKKGRFTSKVRRMFTVDRLTDLTYAKAYLTDGVFTLVAPRKEPAQARKIALGVATTAALDQDKTTTV